ncbi:MAG: CbtB domain-containing protein [Burkholderiales bacterium]
MIMPTQTATVASTRVVSISKGIQLSAVFLLGIVILYGVGFSHISAVHNAAHNMRHSQAFPCH